MPVTNPAVRWRYRLWFWPAVVAVAYLVVVSVTVVLEYTSELSKISRGMYTDTVEPYTFSALLTVPVSVVHEGFSRYPQDVFDAGVYRQLVRDAVWPTVINMLLEAVLIAAIVAVFVLMRRRLRAGPRSA